MDTVKHEIHFNLQGCFYQVLVQCDHIKLNILSQKYTRVGS